MVTRFLEIIQVMGSELQVHEDPTVPNFGPAGRGVILKEGMTIAVEPMVHAGKPQTRILKDGWSVVSKDGSNQPTLNTRL